MPTAENQKTKKVGQKRPPVVPRIVLDSTDGGYEEAMALKAAKEVKPLDLSVPELKTLQSPNAVKKKAGTSSGSGKRVVADLSDLSPKGAGGEGFELDSQSVSPADVILNMDDPNSVLNKYRKEKNAEMAQMLEAKREKMELEEGLKEEEQRVEAFEKHEDEDLEEKEILKDNSKFGAVRGGKVNMKGVSREDMEQKVTPEVEEVEETEEIEEEDYFEEAEEAVEEESTEYEETEEVYEDEEDELEELQEEEVEEEELEEEIEEEEQEIEEEPEPIPEPVKPKKKVVDMETKKSTPKKASKKIEPSIVEDEESDHMGAIKVEFSLNENDIEDLDDDKEDVTDLPSDDERLEDFKAQITQKIKPRTSHLSLKGFTIAKKATASNRIFETSETSAGKWVLPNTGICVQMREISGQKIEYLRENTGSNDPTKARNALKVIYDHIITPKPQSFEAWTKSIAFADYDHLYMPVYLAAFSDANYMPQTCTVSTDRNTNKRVGCGKMFLSENLPIMDLVEFKDDECKKKFWDLYESDRVNPEGLYVSEIVPVSDKFAIAFTEPSLYSVLFEMGTFNKDFQDKYDTVIAFMPYIADIFYIDANTRTLIPVTYKKYENNIAKTNKSKVIKYSNVFDSLTTDEYMNVTSIISAINERNDWMTYHIPEMTCPECKRVIPAEELTASGLVFTRHRLGILGNSSIK